MKIKYSEKIGLHQDSIWQVVFSKWKYYSYCGNKKKRFKEKQQTEYIGVRIRLKGLGTCYILGTPVIKAWISLFTNHFIHELYVLSPAQTLSKMEPAEQITGSKAQEPSHS